MLNPIEMQTAFKVLNMIQTESHFNNLSFTNDESNVLIKCITLKYVSGIDHKMDYSRHHLFSGTDVVITSEGDKILHPLPRTTDVKRMMKSFITLVEDNRIYVFNNAQLSNDSTALAALQNIKNQGFIIGLGFTLTKMCTIVSVRGAMVTENGENFMNPKNSQSSNVSINIGTNNGNVAATNTGEMNNTISLSSQLQDELVRLVNEEGLSEVFKDELIEASNSGEISKLSKFEKFLQSHPSVFTLVTQVISATIASQS